MTSGFRAVNAPGAHFEAQFAANGESGLDIFAIIGLRADGPNFSAREVRGHMRSVVMPHVFERGMQPARTVGPRVPTWQQVNQARDLIENAISANQFVLLQAQWKESSQQI